MIKLYQPLFPWLFFFKQTVNAMAINARLVHPRENPSAAIPAIGPVKAEIIARINPSNDTQINTIIRFRIIILLLRSVIGSNAFITDLHKKY
jgi:hypothetical protein